MARMQTVSVDVTIDPKARASPSESGYEAGVLPRP